MGSYVDGKAAKLHGWATDALMGIAAIALFATGSVSLRTDPILLLLDERSLFFVRVQLPALV